MARLDGKVAIITGAASGIGAATSLRFVEEGAIVLGFDLSDKANDDWKKAVELQPKCNLITGSVADDDVVAKVITDVKDAHGRIDILINCAGFSIPGRTHDATLADWRSQIDVNLDGTYYMSRHVLPIMMKQKSGSIVNIASVAGLIGHDCAAAYNAAKGAVVLLAKSMAVDYGKYGIRANAICPGYVETPGVDLLQGDLKANITAAHNMGRWGEPVEIANACLFLASDEASYVSGIAMPVDGAWTAGNNFGCAEVLGLED